MGAADVAPWPRGDRSMRALLSGLPNPLSVWQEQVGVAFAPPTRPVLQPTSEGQVGVASVTDLAKGTRGVA